MEVAIPPVFHSLHVHGTCVADRYDLGVGEPPPVILYSRTNCHLCDDARAAILAEREVATFPFEEILIDGNEGLEAAYGLRVPVVTVAGREEFEFVVEPSRLRGMLRG
jgi:hypothetical protein